jgi:hypothetical protein
MIADILSRDINKQGAVCVVLSPDATFLTTEDTLFPGVALPPCGARELAKRLMQFADEIEAKLVASKS